MDILATMDAFTDPTWTNAFTTTVLGAAIVGAVVAVFQTALARRARMSEVEELKAPLEEKLDRIVSLSTELSSLNTEVQAEFDLQLAATRKAQLDAENAAALAALSEDQRRATEALVGAQMEAVLGRSSKSERRFQVWLSIGSFLAGVIVTILTPLVFQWLGIGAS